MKLEVRNHNPKIDLPENFIKKRIAELYNGYLKFKHFDTDLSSQVITKELLKLNPTEMITELLKSGYALHMTNLEQLQGMITSDTEGFTLTPNVNDEYCSQLCFFVPSDDPNNMVYDEYVFADYVSEHDYIAYALLNIYNSSFVRNFLQGFTEVENMIKINPENNELISLYEDILDILGHVIPDDKEGRDKKIEEMAKGLYSVIESINKLLTSDPISTNIKKLGDQLLFSYKSTKYSTGILLVARKTDLVDVGTPDPNEKSSIKITDPNLTNLSLVKMIVPFGPRETVFLANTSKQTSRSKKILQKRN